MTWSINWVDLISLLTALHLLFILSYLNLFLQLILDMHFTVEIACFAGYPSRHVQQIASAIITRAIRTFSARGIDPQRYSEFISTEHCYSYWQLIFRTFFCTVHFLRMNGSLKLQRQPSINFC